MGLWNQVNVDKRSSSSSSSSSSSTGAQRTTTVTSTTGTVDVSLKSQRPLPSAGIPVIVTKVT